MPKIPDRRTPERLRHHYEVEREIAARIKAAPDRAARSRILSGMYAELFERVPDHPRLTATRDPAAEKLQIEQLLGLLRPWLRPDLEVLEFGAGTCALAFALAPFVRRVRVAEIADQIPASVARPANFEMVLYDGSKLDLPDASVDLVFSEQFVEHLHPDDAAEHFATVQRILRPGGRYVLRTPEKFTGPHDVSRSFSETPQGFHLREWSYRDLVTASRHAGFRGREAYWNARGIRQRWPLGVALAIESVVAGMPVGMRRSIGHKMIPMVTIALQR